MLKKILSLFIVYHLLCVVLLPNPESMLRYYFGWFLTGYADTFGLGTRWKFFSPNPDVARFFEYDVVPRGGEISTHAFPEIKSPFFFRQAQNRRVTAVNYIAGSYPLIVQLVPRYLCKKHEDAFEIKLRMVTVPFTTLEEAAAGRPLNDMEKRLHNDLGTHRCLSVEHD